MTARLADIPSGALDLVAFVDEDNPDVIIYDLARPYEQNWNFLRLVRNTQSLARRAWVLTTTNKQALEAAVGASPAIEISRGKPYGAREVIEVVKTVMEATGQDSSKGRERWAGTLGVETFSASTAWGCSSWTTRPTSGICSSQCSTNTVPA